MVEAKVVSNSSSEVKSKLALYLAVIGLSIALFPALASAQTPTAPPPVEAVPPAATTAPPTTDRGPRMVGGHIGIAIPLITFRISAPAGTDSTATIGDDFVIAHPIGISVHLNPDWVVDFETIVANHVSPWGGIGFTVDPGVVYTGGPVAAGLRLKFDLTTANANIGVIPLINKGLVPIGDATWFIEGALPITLEKTQGMSIGVVLHTGIGF